MSTQSYRSERSQSFRSQRRSFFKHTLAAATALWFSPILKLKTSALAAEGLKHVSESEPMAKTLGYHVDANKVDPQKWPKRAGADAKQQLCSSCMFYTAVNSKEGKCQIFANNLVTAGGWCNSWAKKTA